MAKWSFREVFHHISTGLDDAQARAADLGFGNHAADLLRQNRFGGIGGFIERYDDPDNKTSYALIFVPNPNAADPKRGEHPGSYCERTRYADFVTTIDKIFTAEGFVFRGTFTQGDESQRLAVIENTKEIVGDPTRNQIARTEIIRIIPVPNRKMAERMGSEIKNAKRSGSKFPRELNRLFGSGEDEGKALNITSDQLR